MGKAPSPSKTPAHQRPQPIKDPSPSKTRASLEWAKPPAVRTSSGGPGRSCNTGPRGGPGGSGWQGWDGWGYPTTASNAPSPTRLGPVSGRGSATPHCATTTRGGRTGARHTSCPGPTTTATTAASAGGGRWVRARSGFHGWQSPRGRGGGGGSGGGGGRGGGGGGLRGVLARLVTLGALGHKGVVQQLADAGTEGGVPLNAPQNHVLQLGGLSGDRGRAQHGSKGKGLNRKPKVTPYHHRQPAPLHAGTGTCTAYLFSVQLSEQGLMVPLCTKKRRGRTQNNVKATTSPLVCPPGHRVGASTTHTTNPIIINSNSNNWKPGWQRRQQQTGPLFKPVSLESR
jgi:hypothetical protein